MTYNGFENYETWNVALWLQNDQYLYEVARTSENYADFRNTLREVGHLLPFDASVETPDRVAWNDSGIDTETMDELIQEMKG